MRWRFWATEKKDEAPQPNPTTNTQPSNGLFSSSQPTETRPPPPRVSSWSSPNLPTDWRHYTSPDVLFPVVVITSTFFIGRRLYKLYLRRFTGASTISPSFWRKRSLLGHVTSVGDGDGLRLFHTPGGRLAGWGWLPGRQIPTGKALKDNTISVRLAGVDAPENAHFGQPAQPGGKEAQDWLTGYVLGRRVRAYIWRKDQFERAIATVYVKRWGGLITRDVGLVMLKKGLATVYQAKTGAEFGNLEEKYRRAEFWAKTFKRGIWKNATETPREFKNRMKNEEERKPAPTVKAAETVTGSKKPGKVKTSAAASSGQKGAATRGTSKPTNS